MAKEIAISKRLKISEAQEYMILSVFCASVFLGVAFSLIMHFVEQISFNARVIMAEDEAITAYTTVIKDTGICRAPKGTTYSDDELKKCDPGSIEVSEIPGTLRANILEELAASPALSSVPKEDNSSCINPATNKKFTYKELQENYAEASGAEALQLASDLIKSCSALRVIPDALPAFKNEEALLASLNRLFIISGWEPESLSPSGSIDVSEIDPNLYSISVNLSIEAGANTTLRVLDNIERSIREFDITRANIEWIGENTLMLQANANAYYLNKSTIEPIQQTISNSSKLIITSSKKEDS